MRKRFTAFLASPSSSTVSSILSLKRSTFAFRYGSFWVNSFTRIREIPCTRSCMFPSGSLNIRATATADPIS